MRNHLFKNASAKARLGGRRPIFSDPCTDSSQTRVDPHRSLGSLVAASRLPLAICAMNRTSVNDPQGPACLCWWLFRKL